MLATRRFAVAPAAYLLLSVAWWLIATISVDGYWNDPLHVAALALWVVLAVALARRETWAWLLLVLVESVWVSGWVEEKPDHWDLFTIQFANVLLLMSPPMLLWVASGPPLPLWLAKQQQTGRVAKLVYRAIGGCGLVASAWLAARLHAAAIPLAALTLIWFVLPTRIDQALGEVHE